MKTLAKLTAFLPLAVTLVWLQFLPERVPVHYDLAGTADRWGSKWELLIGAGAALVLAAVLSLTGWLLRRKAGADEQKRAYAESNGKVVRIVALGVCLLFTALQIFFLVNAGRGADAETDTIQAPMLKLTAAAIGVLLIVIGNFMPKARRNSALGFRCAWSMYNDETWRKSNRFGGRALMAAGLATVIAVLPAPESWAIPILMVLLCVASVATMICARKVYREEAGL